MHVFRESLSFTPPDGWLSHLFRPRLIRDPPVSLYFVHVHMPFAPLIIMLATATALLWYRDRRIPSGHCEQCGYNLTGNVSGICPECGTAIDKDSKVGAA
jgi:hypothetical protein